MSMIIDSSNRAACNYLQGGILKKVSHFVFFRARVQMPRTQRLLNRCLVDVVYRSIRCKERGKESFGVRTTRERFAFPYYLSLAALLTSFLRGLLNKAIPSVGDLWPRRRSCRDIGFVFTVTQWYARTHRSTRLLPFVSIYSTTINSCP